LLPLPPRSANRVAWVPPGAVSVPVRSATNVWSSPTVVAPMSVEQGAPSIENVTLSA
jgi:hypothetical protein